MLLSVVVLAEVAQLLTLKPRHLTLTSFLPLDILSFERVDSLTASTICSDVMDRLVVAVIIQSTYNSFTLLTRGMLLNAVSSLPGTLDRSLVVH